jgi:hypothetical protein
MKTPAAYAELTEALLRRAEVAPLLPTAVHDAQMSASIEALPVPIILRAALHLLNDDLPRCHAIAQSAEGDATFDYLHAIVHRREGDYGNAKYWYGRVAAHPLVEQVYGPDPSEALRFVDRCRRASDRANPELVQVQRREVALFLEHASACLR